MAIGSTLGVVGGGQLGRMFTHAAQTLGFKVVVLEPDAASPAGSVADQHLQAAYDDPVALAELARRCKAVTTEFENVPAPSLAALAAAGITVAPGAHAVTVAQDRRLEKQLLQTCADTHGGAGPVAWCAIASDTDVAHAPATLLPGVLKTARLGYDGKGQRRVDTLAQLAHAFAELGKVPCVLEQRVALAAELSVVLARSADGRMVCLPVQRNLHRDGILAVTEVDDALHLEHSGLSAQQAASAVLTAQAATKTIAIELNYVGVLCVEFFVLTDGSLRSNEIAPRPHNSAHHSIDSCDVSQFDLQVRALAGLPLVAPRLHSPAVMLNLLGDLWFAPGGGAAREPDWPAVLALPGMHLHLYGKAQARPGRKMGHITVTAPSLQQARTQAATAAKLLGLPDWR
jgi:5-(carboxyamino)imidazole ribonucleotide synthase